MLATSLQNIHKTRSVSTNIPSHFHILVTCSGVNKHVQTVNKTTQGMYNKQGSTDHKNYTKSHCNVKCSSFITQRYFYFST